MQVTMWMVSDGVGNNYGSFSSSFCSSFPYEEKLTTFIILLWMGYLCNN